MAQTAISHLRAVGERDFFELGAAFAYLSKCYVTYDLHVEARQRVYQTRGWNKDAHVAKCMNIELFMNTLLYQGKQSMYPISLTVVG